MPEFASPTPDARRIRVTDTDSAVQAKGWFTPAVFHFVVKGTSANVSEKDDKTSRDGGADGRCG